MDNLKGKGIIFLNETLAPDKAYAKEIGKFREKIIQSTQEARLFSIDLSYTYISDDAVSNLVKILSQKVTVVGGKMHRPYEYVKRIDLSHTRFTEEGLLALKNLLAQDNLKYVDIRCSYASNADSIERLYGALTRKYGYVLDEEGHFALDEEGQDKALQDFNKIIWLMDYFFSDDEWQFVPLTQEMRKAHKEFYRIK